MVPPPSSAPEQRTRHLKILQVNWTRNAILRSAPNTIVTTDRVSPRCVKRNSPSLHHLKLKLHRLPPHHIAKVVLPKPPVTRKSVHQKLKTRVVPPISSVSRSVCGAILTLEGRFVDLPCFASPTLLRRRRKPYIYRLIRIRSNLKLSAMMVSIVTLSIPAMGRHELDNL